MNKETAHLFAEKYLKYLLLFLPIEMLFCFLLVVCFSEPLLFFVGVSAGVYFTSFVEVLVIWFVTRPTE